MALVCPAQAGLWFAWHGAKLWFGWHEAGAHGATAPPVPRQLWIAQHGADAGRNSRSRAGAQLVRPGMVLGMARDGSRGGQGRFLGLAEPPQAPSPGAH